MQFTRLPVPVLAAGAAVALGVALFVTYGPVAVVVLVAAVAALVGLYRLRHYARATLVYSRSTAGTATGSSDGAADGSVRPDRSGAMAGHRAPRGSAAPGRRRRRHVRGVRPTLTLSVSHRPEQRKKRHGATAGG